jgi:hypothetical protein
MLPKAGNAQPKSGDFLLGGGIEGSNLKWYSPDTNTLIRRNLISAGFSPQISVFILPHLAVGVMADMQYFIRKDTEHTDDTISTVKERVTKFRSISVAMGGFVSYYYPIKAIRNLFWVNRLSYVKGYVADGISFAAFVSSEKNTFSRSGFFEYNLSTGINYFFKPNVCLSVNMTAFSLRGINTQKSIGFLTDNGYLSIGLNYLIISEDE